MKIVFLDVDGVLNSPDFQIHRYQRGPGRHPIDPECVAHLNALTSQTQARIVVSSTWRTMGLTAIRRVLRAHGVVAPIVGCTPSLVRRHESGLAIATERGREIQAWLDTTRFRVERFVILDDDEDMNDLLPHLVRTDFRAGLAAEDVIRSLERLAQVLPG